MDNFHAQSITQSISLLQTDKKKGLALSTVQQLQQKYGKNELGKKRQRASGWRIFFDQWKSPLIIILLVAGTVSGLLGEAVDMTIIYVTAVLNALIGFFQEYKANRALERLQSLVTHDAIVIRDGEKQVVSTRDVVPGDIVITTAGDQIPADGRIIDTNALEVNEAALTGESEPIVKKTRRLSADTALANRANMVYRGTTVVAGEATYIVTAIGRDTELGKIATMVAETTDDLTPLQEQLASLAKVLSIIVVLLAVGLFFIGLFFGGGKYDILTLFETAVAVAVAAVPEGLVISLTVILAIGMQFIVKRQALVRKLVAAETLGSVSVICTDKTGTLTEGHMEVTHLVSDNGYDPLAQRETLQAGEERIITIATAATEAVCTDQQHPLDRTSYIGDTTDVAIMIAAQKYGVQTHTTVSSVPFTSERMFVATQIKDVDGGYIAVKGAFEKLLPRCNAIIKNGKNQKLTEKHIRDITKRHDDLTADGLRVLAVAYKPYEQKGGIEEEDVHNIVFVGFIALSDPVRAGVKETIALAKRAGIRTVMITGDNPKTAAAIAKQLYISRTKEVAVCDGNTLDGMNDAELQQAAKKIAVYARVEPRHKIRIVRALQANDEVVAMTGDGVNDAPALKGADIGVAVGSGTDVAKETADMVLLDDRFQTIVAAVEEGRTIYQNIKKVVLYLLSGSFAEVVMITGSIVAGLPVAALPAQILWVNLIEDAFPTMALAFDSGDKENMADPPRKKEEPLVDKEMKVMITLKSILANVALFGIFLYMLHTTGDIKLTRTIVFVGFAIDALFFIFSIRSLRHMIWQIPIFNNKWLLISVGFGWLMLLLAIYAPPLQFILHTVPLELGHWGMMIAFGIFNLCLMEIVKALFLLKSPQHAYGKKTR